MATRPPVCPPTQVPGLAFNRTALVEVSSDGNYSPNPLVELKDFLMEVKSFSHLRISVAESKSYLLSQTDIGDDFGYESFVLIKVTYPDDVPTSKRYLEWEYNGANFYIGELMILSGKRTSSIDAKQLGWNISADDVFYKGGGIIFTNPHSTFKVKLEILVAR
jgi:hypothetical protein